jgi:hypothetical protein
MAKLVLIGREISVYFPMEVEVESKVHRGFVDVAWYGSVSKAEKVYFCVFEIETSKSDWERIRSNSAKLVSLNPAIVYHIFKPGIGLKKTERNELKRIHSERTCYVINNERRISEMFKRLGGLFSRIDELGYFKTIRLPKHTFLQYDKYVKDDVYESVEEAIRVTLGQKLALLHGVSKEKYIPCCACGSLRVYFNFEIRKAICLNCGSTKSFRTDKHSLEQNLEKLFATQILARTQPSKKRTSGSKSRKAE